LSVPAVAKRFPGRAGTAALVARAWGVKPLAAAIGGTIVLSTLFRGPLSVPGRRDVAEVIWPLAPCLLALTIPRVAVRAYADQERCAPRSGWRRRLCFVAAVTASVIAACGLLALLHPFSVLVRNSLLLAGVGFASTVVLPASTRWIPPSMLPIVSWLLGARSAGEPPAGWAVLLHRPGSALATQASIAIFVLGAGLYVAAARPWRP
jgi:hypothetical protein